MELNQGNTTLSSLSEVSKKMNKSNFQKITSESQFKSAKRFHLDSKSNTSKEIIENFARSSNHDLPQDKSIKISKLNKKYHQNYPSHKMGYGKTKYGSLNNNNQNQNITLVDQKGIVSDQKVILKNLKLQTNSDNKFYQIKKKSDVKVENNLIFTNKDQRKKTENSDKANQSKRKAKIEEMGHEKFVREINKKSNDDKNDKKMKNELFLNNKVKDKSVSSSNFEDKIENTKITIEFESSEQNQSDMNFNNKNENFKESLLHMLNHYNTKIKGIIKENNIGEFKINTEKGNYIITIHSLNKHVEINIHSDSVTELENEIKNIEKTILEKLPNIETIKINIKSISFDCSIKNSNSKNIKLNQNSIFKLNFLA